VANPAVELFLRTDGGDVAARERAIRNVVAIAVRPSFTPADAAMLDPSVPRPDGPPRQARAVRRAKPRTPQNTIRPRFLTDATRELFDRLGPTERRVIAGSVILRWDLGEGDGMIARASQATRARAVRRSAASWTRPRSTAMRAGESLASSSPF
jgi:hypothetical protein